MKIHSPEKRNAKWMGRNVVMVVILTFVILLVILLVLPFIFKRPLR